jgi:hypothetical protein
MAFAISPDERFAAYNAQMCLALGRQVRDDLREQSEAATRSKEGRDREATAGLRHTPDPLLKCGLVAGIRHCHTEDAPDHLGRPLHFSDSRKKTMRMVKTWIAEGVRVGVNLGNVIDQRCGLQRKHEIALQNIKGVLCDDYKTGTWRFRLHDRHSENKFRADVMHLLGEHDLQHFSLDSLVESLNMPVDRPEHDCLYHSSACPGGWRLVFIDTNDVSTRSSLLSKRDKAREWLDRARRPGCPALVSRCGAVGETQLGWLRDQLSAAKQAGDRVVLFSHSPLNETIARQGGEPELICWNFKQVMDVIFSVSNVVVCCISGQQLNGGHGVDDMTRKGRGRVHHLSIRNAVAEPTDADCFGILELFENRIVLQGYGGVQPITIGCPTVLEAKAMVAREEAQQKFQQQRAEQQREADQSRVKLEREERLAAEMILEEEQALVLDREERRLWRIAEEAAALERLKDKERMALEYAGKASASEEAGENAPAEEVGGEAGSGEGKGISLESDEATK